MDAENDIREFLMSRRARITPEQAELPIYGSNRREPGLRREEVAMLAGISVEYYTRLERGKATGVSEDVLEGIVRALRLDEAERTHLFDLFHVENTLRRAPSQERVRSNVIQILDAMIEVAACVRNGRLDILAANQLGEGLYSEVFADPTRPANIARFLFLDPRAESFFVDWGSVADDAVAILRAEAGRDPYDRRLSDLVGELSTRSDEFGVRWASHNVKFHRTGTKRLHHPIVGDFTLSYEAFDLPSDTGQRILTYIAEPGSRSHEALSLLASWLSTRTERVDTDDPGVESTSRAEVLMRSRQ